MPGPKEIYHHPVESAQMRGLYLRATRTYVSKAGQQLPSSTEANDTFTQSYADLA